MHRNPHRGPSLLALLRLLAVLPAVLGLAMVAGCANQARTADDAHSGHGAGQVQASESEDDSSVADSAAAAARRLEEAMARTQASEADPSRHRVQWQQTWPERSEADDSNGDVAQSANATGDDPSRAPASASEGSTNPAGDPASGSESEAESESSAESVASGQLLSQLIERVRRSDEPALRRALTAATLSAAMGEANMDPQVFANLNHAQRRMVERYHRMVLTTSRQLAAGETDFDRQTLLDQLDVLFEHEPIEIRRLVLCREVSGYGVYEPFERHRFLAGESQRVILYVELDHFHAEPTDDDRYEVKLQQQAVLYNESDGLAVWRQDPVQITDVSRNRRHDFFVVQLITLPQRLNVGSYRLKVRVTDEHGGSLDEITTGIELVADERLLNEGSD